MSALHGDVGSFRTARQAVHLYQDSSNLRNQTQVAWSSKKIETYIGVKKYINYWILYLTLYVVPVRVGQTKISYYSKINEVHTALSMVPADPSDIWNTISSVRLTCHNSVGLHSFQKGGEPDGEFDTTFTRLFRAAIIEFEYIFARMRIPIW